jgi:hypothetical protein
MSGSRARKRSGGILDVRERVLAGPFDQDGFDLEIVFEDRPVHVERI